MAKLVLTLQAQDRATETVQALNKEVQVLSQTLSSIKVNKDLTAQINALTKHYTALVKAQEKVISNNNKQAISDEKLSQQQAITAKKVAEAAAAQARLEKAQQKTTSTTEQLQKKFANLLSTIKSLKNAYPQGTFDEMERGVRSNLQALKDGSKSVDELSTAYDTLSTKVAVAKAETDKVTTAVVKSGDSIASLAKKFLLWQVTATLVMQPLRLIQNALSSVNETLVKTEDAVIALQRVLPSGSATDSEISSRLYKVAQDYGQTFENVSQIATNFARTGMSWADTIKATEAAILALNVAELDAEEATTGLIAILSQFNLEASDLETVIDKLNKTADNFPVTTEKILAALQRTGSAASNAKLSLEQTIALITALSKATGRSGENIGTALNSLIQYSSKASALDTFAALSEDSAKVVAEFRQGGKNILDVWRQVSEEIKNLKSDQADLLDQYFATEDGEALKDALDGELEDIYTELGGVYDTANTFRKNYFIALLGNMDTVEQAMGTLGNAAGYSQEENKKYLDTYTARVNKLNAQWEELANNEQGWLSFKKGLVSAGSDLLNLIKYTGGLSTAFSAAGTAAVALFGPTIIAKLQKFSLSLKSVDGFVLNLRTRIGNLIGAELELSFAQDAERVAQEALNAARASGIGVVEAEANAEKAAAAVAEASAAKAKASAAAWTSALTVVMLVLTVASSLDSTIRNAIEKNAEAERKAREEQDARIAKANESIDAQKQEVQSMEDVAASVENLRNVLNSSTASEEEKRTAQEKLLQIQNTLIESNNDYKDSLDLTNGALAEQLGLIEQLTTEQLKQKAQDFLSQNKSEIEIAQSRLKSRSTTNTNALFSAQGWLSQYDFRDVLNKAIEGAGVGDTTSIHEDNTYTFFDNYGKKVGEGFKNGFWDGVGALFGFSTVFDAKSYVGEANVGLSFSGTVEEQIDAIKALKTYIADNRDELGLTAEQHNHINEELKKQLGLLDSEEYKQVKLFDERVRLAEGLLNGTVEEDEYLEKVYGIQKDISKEIGEQTNDISKVVGAYDDLIKALEKLRDAEKESLELEERKQAVLEAQKALEAARNEATARRYNEATGQWEWQTDEKAIAEAEENLQKARDELEKQAYDTIIDQLENKTATNEGLNNLLYGLKDFLGEEFINNIKEAIRGTTNVDLDQPVKSYDSGGIANGMGYMPKATDRPETVNNPDLTAQILSPVSNAEFHRYVHDMGLLFETARQYAQTPVVERIGGATDNRVDNSGQIIMNGVYIGSDRRNSSLDETLAIAGIVPNVNI